MLIRDLMVWTSMNFYVWNRWLSVHVCPKPSSPMMFFFFFKYHCHFGVYLATTKTWFSSLLIGRCSVNQFVIFYALTLKVPVRRMCKYGAALRQTRQHTLVNSGQFFGFHRHTDKQCCRMLRRNVISTLVAGQRIDLDADKRLARLHDAMASMV